MRPAFIICATCGARVPVGKRGPIPKVCSANSTCRGRKRRQRLADPGIPVVTSPQRVDPPAPQRVAALFVREDGPYPRMAHVDPWPESRDATRYAGPWPVVAHPPCAPWGFNRHRSTQRPDLAVFAVYAVRKWGGVLEHPAASRLWRAMELAPPPVAPSTGGAAGPSASASRASGTAHPNPHGSTWSDVKAGRNFPCRCRTHRAAFWRWTGEKGS